VGIIGTYSKQITSICSSLLEGEDFSNTKYITPILKDRDFEFFDGEYESANEQNLMDTDSVLLTQEPKFLPVHETMVEHNDPIDEYRDEFDGDSGNRLLVDFYHPDEHLPEDNEDRKDSNSEYSTEDIQGIYYNDIGSGYAPYGTNWHIRLLSEFDLSVRLRDIGLLVNGTSPVTWMNSTITLNLTVTVSIYSGWGLKGVDYEMDLDEMMWIISLLQNAWDQLESGLGGSLDSLMNLIDIIANFVTKIMGYANDVIEWLNNQVQILIAQVQAMIGETLKSAVLKVFDLLNIDTLDFTVHGIHITFEYNLKYFSQMDSEESVPAFTIRIQKDADLDFLLSVATAPGTKWAMGVTLVGSFTICDMDFDLILDPFMAFYNHMFILNGRKLNATGDGWGMEIVIPECVSYKKLDYSLPVGPDTGINIPPLGISIFPTIGVNLKYSFPSKDNLVVNEFDYNKMELYNPTDDDIRIQDWVVENRNEPRKSFTIDDDITLEAGEYVDITYDDYYTRPENISLTELAGKALEDKDTSDASKYIIEKLDGVDNSFLGTGKGLLSAGEGLKLRKERDEEGNDGEIVDSTPIKRPSSPLKGTNKNTTWQRKYDAGYEWVSKEPTFGGLNNDDPPTLDIKSLILNALMDSFTEAYMEHQIQQKTKSGNITLEDVVNCLKATINKFIERVLELIRKVIIEVEFYLDLGIAAIGMPEPAGGIILSFVIDGEGIALLLEWLVKCLMVFVNKLLYGDTGGGYPPLPGDLPEHMFIRIVSYFGLDVLPDSIKEILEEKGEIQCSELKMNIMIQVNLPVIGCLAGHDWGNWQVDFGIFISGKTGPIVDALFSSPQGNDPDFWLVKGRVFQIRGGIQ